MINPTHDDDGNCGRGVIPVSERFLRLSIAGEQVMTYSPTGSPDRPLPPVPASRLDWLSNCAGRLWRERRRCLAALLLVDPLRGAWTITFPRQRCGANSVSWAVTAADCGELADDWRLGGTFQAVGEGATRGGGGDGLDSLVPAPDGLHFLLVHDGHGADLRGFIRAGGELRPATREPIVLNDWAVAVRDAMPRLVLA